MHSLPKKCKGRDTERHACEVHAKHTLPECVTSHVPQLFSYITMSHNMSPPYISLGVLSGTKTFLLCNRRFVTGKSKARNSVKELLQKSKRLLNSICALLHGALKE